MAVTLESSLWELRFRFLVLMQPRAECCCDRPEWCDVLDAASTNSSSRLCIYHTHTHVTVVGWGDHIKDNLFIKIHKAHGLHALV